MLTEVFQLFVCNILNNNQLNIPVTVGILS